MMDRGMYRSMSHPGHITVSRSSIQAVATERSPGLQGIMPLSFPTTRGVLWDHRPTGSHIMNHLSQYRNPTILFEEKTLRIAHRYAEECKQDTYLCHFIASLNVQPDEEGVQLVIDRFESHKSVAGMSSFTDAGQIYIPCIVKKNNAKPTSSSDDYKQDFETLHRRCTCKSRVDLNHFLSLRAYCSYHGSRDNFIFHIDFDLITMDTPLKMVPVNQVPVVPTALSKNLAGPLSMSEVQGDPKSGYLTMDQTRKLLLVLESDPKVHKLPLVGIWMSGVSNIHAPFVWASCLRYIYNNSLQERVCQPPEPFLIALYSPLHSKPEFYECSTSNGSQKLNFELYSCHDVIQLPKDGLSRSQSPLELEMLKVDSGAKLTAFQAALQETKDLTRTPHRERGNDSTSHMEDIMPRATPAPSAIKTHTIKPSVPEVSILFDENDHYQPRQPPKPTRTSHLQNHEHNKSKHKPPSSHRGALKPVNSVPQSSHSLPASPIVSGPQSLRSNTQPGSPEYGLYQNQMPMQGVAPENHQTGGPKNQQYGYNPHERFYGQQNVYPQSAPRGPPQNYPQNYPSQEYYRPQNVPHNRPPPQHLRPPSRPIGPVGPPQRSMSHPNLPTGYPNGYYGPQQNAGYPPNSSNQYYGPEFYNNGQTYSPNGMPYNNNPPPPRLPSNQSPYQPHLVPQSPHEHSNNQVSPAHSHNGAINQNIQNLHSSPPAANQQPHVTSRDAVTSPPTNHTASDSGVHVSPQSVDHNTSACSSQSNIPPEVYQLLKSQDEQLKTLREQLAQLMANQGSPLTSQTQTSTTHDMGIQMSNPSTPVKRAPKQTCEMAINTSLWWPQKPDNSTELNQSTTGSNQCQTESQLSRPTVESATTTTQGNVNTSPSQTSSHDNGTLASFGDLQLTQQLGTQEESMVSEMMVDMPAYTSLSPDKCQHSSSGCTESDGDSTRSPLLGESVSMYDKQRDDSGETGDTGLGDSQPDMGAIMHEQKQFYQNLMGNVKKLLEKNQSSDQSDLNDSIRSDPGPTSYIHHSHGNNNLSSASGNNTSSGSSTYQRQGVRERSFHNVAERTKKQLEKMGVDFQNDTNATDKSMKVDQSLYMLDPSLLPKINYVSMMLDSDTSSNMDALAMKYLNDEQLSELARLHMKSPGGKGASGAGLGQVLDASHGNISMHGNANHMSFASRKYLERYGLLDADKSRVASMETTRNDSTKYDDSMANPAEPAMMNVKNFLERLANKSYIDSSLVYGDGAQGDVNKGSTVSSGCHSNHSVTSQPINYSSDGDSVQISGKSASTPAPPPPRVPRGRYSDVTPHESPITSKPTDSTPLRVFDKTPREHLEGSFEASPTRGADDTVTREQVHNVLDIERLRELPKLL